MTQANERQHGGDHYKKKTIEPWDFIISNEISFLDGTAIKYLTRWKDKGGIEDLLKARHYIDKLIEVETQKTRTKKKGWLYDSFLVRWFRHQNGS